MVPGQIYDTKIRNPARVAPSAGDASGTTRKEHGSRVEIICVGTELLTGKVNTHTSAISRLLAGIGLSIARETAVGDSLPEITDAIRGAWERSQVVLICGGLGPTFDDITREAAAAAFGVRLIYRPKIYAAILKRYRRFLRRIPAENRRQAFVLEGAKALANKEGSAPGQLFQEGNKTAILFPGPFWELGPMLEGALPTLKSAYAPSVFTRKTIYHLCGIPESAADEKLEPLLKNPRPGLEFTILGHPGLVHFHVVATGSSRDAADRLARWARAQVMRHVGKFIFGTDDQTLESAIGNLLRKRGLTLAAAESCTAGLLSGRLTNVPGSSDYYLGGVVSYADAVKQAELGVSRETLKMHGAVSEPCAREMAEGARRRLSADIGISITGIAGPGGGNAKKPVGLTFIGLARQGRPTRVHRYFFSGSRDLVRERAVNAALSLLYSSLKT